MSRKPESGASKARRRWTVGLALGVVLVGAGSFWLRSAGEPDVPEGYLARMEDWDLVLDQRFGPLTPAENHAIDVRAAVDAFGRFDESAGSPEVGGPTPTAAARAHLDATRPYLEQLRAALAAGRCRFRPMDEVSVIYWHRASQIALANGHAALADSDRAAAMEALEDLRLLQAGLAEYPVFVGVAVRSVIVRSACTLARELADGAVNPTELQDLRDRLPVADLSREAVHAVSTDLAYSRASAEGFVGKEELPWYLHAACTIGVTEAILGPTYQSWEAVISRGARGDRPAAAFLRDLERSIVAPPRLFGFLAPIDLSRPARGICEAHRMLAVTRAGLGVLIARAETGDVAGGDTGMDPVTDAPLAVEVDGSGVRVGPSVEGTCLAPEVDDEVWELPGS